MALIDAYVWRRCDGGDSIFVESGVTTPTDYVYYYGECYFNTFVSLQVAGVVDITDEGDVGIGTSSPGEKLEVEWDTNVDAGFFRGTTDTDITGTFSRSPDGTLWYQWIDDAGVVQTSTTKP